MSRVVDLILIVAAIVPTFGCREESPQHLAVDKSIVDEQMLFDGISGKPEILGESRLTELESRHSLDGFVAIPSPDAHFTAWILKEGTSSLGSVIVEDRINGKRYRLTCPSIRAAVMEEAKWVGADQVLVCQVNKDLPEYGLSSYPGVQYRVRVLIGVKKQEIIYVLPSILR